MAQRAGNARGNFDWHRIQQGYEEMEARYSLTDGWAHRMATMAYTQRDKSALRKYLDSTYRKGGDSRLAKEVWQTSNGLLVAKVYLNSTENQTPAVSYIDALRAAVTKDTREIKRLFARGFNPKDRDHLGNSLLHSAVKAGDGEMISLLIELGMNPNSYDGGGDTPLLVAARGGCTSCFISLLEGGADVHRATRNGRTALMLTAYIRNPYFIQTVITGASETINTQNQFGKTALMYAAQYNNVPLAAILLKQPRIEFNNTDTNGKTALHYSIEHPDGIVAGMLLRAGADHTIGAQQGLDIAEIAARSNSGALQGLLRQHGIKSGKNTFPSR